MPLRALRATAYSAAALTLLVEWEALIDRRLARLLLSDAR